MRVKSKVDVLVTLIIFSAVIIIAVGIMVMPQEGKRLSYAFGLPVVAFLLWLYFGTYYELRDDYLYCRSGPFVERIPYDRIKSVRQSHNMLSSMALSAERIEIKQHGKGFILGTTYISPEDREEFMRELTSRCKNLE